MVRVAVTDLPSLTGFFARADANRTRPAPSTTSPASSMLRLLKGTQPEVMRAI